MNWLCKLLRFDFLPASTDVALLVLRVWIGISMLALHGVGKIANFAEYAERFADPFGIGKPASLVLCIFGEVVCSALLAVGLLTRFAALSGVITMSVAFFHAHGGALSGERSGEMAFLYLCTYVVLLIAGGGRFALDAACRRCRSPGA